MVENLDQGLDHEGEPVVVEAADDGGSYRDAQEQPVRSLAALVLFRLQLFPRVVKQESCEVCTRESRCFTRERSSIHSSVPVQNLATSLACNCRVPNRAQSHMNALV